MEKKIEDYLHLYLGCECQFEFTTITERKELRVGKLIRIDITGIVPSVGIHCFGYHDLRFAQVKPILRPLSDMSEEELMESVLLFFMDANRDIVTQIISSVKKTPKQPKENIKLGTRISYSAFKENGDHYMTGTLSPEALNPEQFIYLLKQGFDLFDLIPSNLALDKTKL